MNIKYKKEVPASNQATRNLMALCLPDEWEENKYDILFLKDIWIHTISILVMGGCPLKNSLIMLPKVDEYSQWSGLKPSMAAESILRCMMFSHYLDKDTIIK